MPIILGANSATAGGFTIENSCCFNKADSPYLEKTQSAGNRKKWSFSLWFRIGDQDGLIHYLLGAKSDASNYTNIEGGDGANLIRFGNLIGGGYDSFKKSNQYIRDPSQWYHMLFVYDSANADASKRQLVYLNGTQVTSWASDTTTTLNQDSFVNDSGSSLMIGNLSGESSWFDGYMAEVVLLDGTAAAPTDFGEFDEDSPTIWKPIDVSGLTFGTNGFYLDFKDSANLGNDANGGTDFTESGIIAADQCQDTPTNVFCTANPLDNYFQQSNFSNGNNTVEITQPGGNHGYCSSTMGVAAGLWYFEAKPTTGTDRAVGFVDIPQPDSSENMGQGGTGSTFCFRHNGQSKQGGSSSAYGSAYSTDDIIGVYLDLTANKAYFAINGTIQNSGTGLAITAAASTTTGFYKPGADSTNGSDTTWQFNFGNGCFNGVAITGTTYKDSNDYGIFKYSPNDGGAASFDSSAKNFLALNSKNLSTDGG
mgnify:FL=1